MIRVVLAAAGAATAGYVALRLAGAGAVVAFELCVVALGLLAARWYRRADVRTAVAGGRRGEPLGPAVPPDVARIERAVTFGVATAFDAHYRLRPLLRRLAAERLTQFGVRLDVDHDRAHAILGDAAWAYLRPDRPAPTDRFGRGIHPAALEDVVAALERLRDDRSPAVGP